MIPCFDEEARLRPEAFDDFLNRSQRVGLVLVNDGSRDQTLSLLRDLEARHPDCVRVVDQQPNRGKAEAVRAGVAVALAQEPQHVGYWDADLATPLEVIEEAAELMDADADVDIVMGARVALLGRNIERRAARHYLGRVFATVASAVLGLPVYDTQCGAKLFRVTELLPRLFDRPFTSRWVFDVEILARFIERGGRPEQVLELPLKRWTDVGASKVKPFDFVQAAGDLGAIYLRYRGPRRLRDPRPDDQR